MNRHDVGLEETVADVEDVLKVWLLHVFLGNVGENTTLTRNLGVLLKTDLVLREVHVRVVAMLPVERPEDPGSLLPVLPHLGSLANGKTAVEGTPHVPESLLVTSLNIDEKAANASLATTSHVALADRAQNGAAGQVSVQREKALDIHMKILSNGFSITIPATNTIDEFERQRVDRRGRRDCRSTVEARHTTSAPHDVGYTYDRRNAVSIAVEDDGRGIKGCSGRFRVGNVHVRKQGEVGRGEVAVSCKLS